MSHYSDILGYVTGGQRVTINGLDMALAVAPPVVPAGRPFQVVLLAQNTTNTPVELNAALSLPVRDAKRQKDNRLGTNRDSQCDRPALQLFIRQPPIKTNPIRQAMNQRKDGYSDHCQRGDAIDVS